MMITTLLKTTVLALLLNNILYSDVISDRRGSIVTADNKILGQSTNEGSRTYKYNGNVEPLLGIYFSDGWKRFGLEEAMDIPLSEGQNVYLSMDLSCQIEVNTIVDRYKKLLDADEVLVAVMESATGKILTMTTSNRYDIDHLREKDIPNLIPKFSAYPYEPGAVMMPITLALALDNGLVEPETVVSTYNGKMEFQNGRFITDSEKHNALSTAEMIRHSSNIGIAQVSWLLSAYGFRKGLEKFGFANRSGIEFYRDKEGFIQSASKLENKMYSSGTAYGYGMLATFTQLLKAYNVFNNEGSSITPHLVDFIQGSNNKSSDISSQNEKRQTVSTKTAAQIHRMLVENVKHGTGTNAQHDGLEIGGKTGTAHIYRDGKYRREYHSSFYGFANDGEGNKYTIGVMVIRAKASGMFYASLSAVPIFKDTVDILVKKQYLK
jgi:cell division protein FtsI (penicillin-binding protein 3)